MAEAKANDPEAQFREHLTRWEREFDANMNRFMGTEAYSAWMNQVQQGQLMMQKAFSEFVTTQLEWMNVPTREDVIRIAEGQQRIERRLEQLEQTMTRLASKAAKKNGNSSRSSAPPRTKRPTRLTNSE